jgi:hypothetical protein
MKQALYRILAAAIVIGAGYAAFLFASDRDFRTAFPFGTLNAVLGFLLIIPTFTAYAVYGENTGNRVLIPLLKLVQLPTALLERIVQRYVVLPSELNQPRDDHDKPAVSSEPLTSGNSGSGSITDHSDTA